MWFVYVLGNPANTTYTGIAKDPHIRLSKHNSGHGAKFTKGRGPWRLIYVEGPMPHGEALRQERTLKKSPAFKRTLKTAPDFYAHSADLPAAPGAYVLMITLTAPVTVHLPRREDQVLAPGRYLYCGSAKGPGGLKARLSRHWSPDKTVRWHVDQLTLSGHVMGAWIVPDGDECALARQLMDFPIPLPGFGSSDCITCRSHLFSWPQGMPLPLRRA